MSFGTKLKGLRERKGINQDELGEILGVSNVAISHYERDARKPTPELLSDVADYFNVTIDYLLDRTPDPYYKLNEKDERSIATRIDTLISDLDGLKYSKEEGEFDDETIELIKMALEQGARIAKMEAKRKFTPKKYRGVE